MPLKVKRRVQKSSLTTPDTGRLQRVFNPEQEFTSTYRILFNTNRKFSRPARAALEEQIPVAIETAMDSDFEDIFKFTPNVNQTPKNNQRDYFHDVDIDYSFEVGPKFKKFHTHMTIKIKHTGLLQLDYKELRNAFLRQLPDEAPIKNGIWFRVTWEKDKTRSKQIYFEKEYE